MVFCGYFDKCRFKYEQQLMQIVPLHSPSARGKPNTPAVSEKKFVSHTHSMMWHACTIQIFLKIQNMPFCVGACVCLVYVSTCSTRLHRGR